VITGVCCILGLLEGQYDSISLLMVLALHGDIAINHTHNSIPELLMNEGFDGMAIDEDTLIKAINDWIDGNWPTKASIWPPVFTHLILDGCRSYPEHAR
jgi:hypothetical protein